MAAHWVKIEKPQIVRALAAAILGFLLAAGPVTADDITPAMITPGAAIGPVSLGMSASQIIGILGQPSTRRGREMYFPGFELTVTFEKGIAVQIKTTSRRFRTIYGAGVGVSPNEATRLLGDEKIGRASCRERV